jgi:peptidoglycan/LPS O-acetylase OafA/YrhL
MLGVRAPWYIWLLAAGFLALFIWIISEWYPANAWNKTLAFTGGMLPAFYAKHPAVRRLAAHPLTSVLMVLVLAVAALYSPEIYSPFSFVCTAFIFSAIACGNTFFGLLTWRPSCLLGQIAFSLYIVHGLVYFSCFMLLMGQPLARAQAVGAHWLITAACGLALVTVCALSYRFVERPCVEATPGITARAKRYLLPE